MSECISRLLNETSMVVARVIQVFIGIELAADSDMVNLELISSPEVHY